MNLEWLSAETIKLLLEGLSLTIWLTAITSVLSLVLGVVVGSFKLSKNRLLRWSAAIYVEIHRNIPALVLIIFWAFAVPHLFPTDMRRALFFDNSLIYEIERLTGLSVPYYTLAVGIALTLNTSAYLAELYRAGVGTIPQNIVDAARTLGASSWIVLSRILIPRGLGAAFPAISTRLIHHMKNTTLAALVASPEFFHNTQTAISRSFRAVEYLLLAAVVYLVLSGLYAKLLRWIEVYLNRRPSFSREQITPLEGAQNLVLE